MNISFLLLRIIFDWLLKRVELEFDPNLLMIPSLSWHTCSNAALQGSLAESRHGERRGRPDARRLRHVSDSARRTHCQAECALDGDSERGT